MLTSLRRRDAIKVLARDSERTDGPFSCPRCLSELVLRKGRIRVHHFAHKPPVTCSLGLGESAEHHRAKLQIFDALLRAPNVTDVELEKDLGICIPDVFARINGAWVAVEIQRSVLSVAEIVARTTRYRELGIAVLWTGLPGSGLATEDRYSPRAWEKWAHAAYFGRVYFWESDDRFLPVHFDPFKLWVPSKSWYESGGEEQSAGGYERTSKRWRTPNMGTIAALSTDFAPKMRPAWKGGTVVVPDCALFIDQQRAWWK